MESPSLAEKMKILWKALTDTRLKNDIRAFREVFPFLIRLGWDFLDENGVLAKLNTAKTIKELMGETGVKNEKMLEAILDILVGASSMRYENDKYSLITSPPFPSIEGVKFLYANYPGSMEWISYMYDHSGEALMKKPSNRTEFDDREAGRLWDIIMRESPHSFRKFAIQKLLSPLKDGSKVLEIGCGSGTGIEMMLYEGRKDLQITGIDPSRDYLKKAKEKLEFIYDVSDQKLKKVIKDVRLETFNPKKGIPKDEKYDAVFMSIVLNHIEHKKHFSFFRDVKEILKPSGAVCVYQIINQSKFQRTPIWVMYAVPSHTGYPFKDDYFSIFDRLFKDARSYFKGSIVYAKK